MAQKTVVTLIDDLTGEEDSEVTTREFWVDGNGYEIDLGKDNSQDFDDFMETYIAAARRLPRRAAPAGVRTGGRKTVTTGTGPARRDREQTKAIRTWAAENGYQISERGRIPAPVEEAYEKHKGRPIPKDEADEAGAA